MQLAFRQRVLQMPRTTTTSAPAVDLLPASDHTIGCCSPTGRAFCRWPYGRPAARLRPRWAAAHRPAARSVDGLDHVDSTPAADLLLASDHDRLLVDRPRAGAQDGGPMARTRPPSATCPPSLAPYIALVPSI